MKSLSLALAAAVVLSSTASTAAVITLGRPLAVACYRFAEARDSGRDALRTCDEAVASPLDSKNRAATFVNRGVLRMLRDDWTGAEADFDVASALDPELPDAWMNKAFLRLRAGNGQAALPLLERALELRPRRPALAYYARGIANEQSGNLRAAYADLTRARALEPAWDMPAAELARYRVVSR